MFSKKPEGFDYQGYSNSDKQNLKIGERRKRAEEIKRKQRAGETFGNIKVSRRIPEQITDQVSKRDFGRNFGRPNHVCERPGSPHHIIHFEKFLNGEVDGVPHTIENLEAPCSECHKLAHEMKIPSGVSIETFFRQQFI